jgi:hypothetical protein
MLQPRIMVFFGLIADAAIFYFLTKLLCLLVDFFVNQFFLVLMYF